ncbi:ribonuclease H2 subunit A-like isoform X2 [Andrographis paniculata]|nr:ribonuclease H2 subunit A-like isoform X2 [Andrographis paniculata]
MLDETAENLHRNFRSGYPGDPQTKAWLSNHKHSVFGFPKLVRFSWGTCSAYSKDFVEVLWESGEDGNGSNGKRQMSKQGTASLQLREKVKTLNLAVKDCKNRL